jgi:HEAT repeat protein
MARHHLLAASRRSFILLVLPAMLFGWPVAVWAQDPLVEFKRVLVSRPFVDPLLPADKQQLELKKFYDDREKKLARIIDTQLKSFGDLRQVLMLKDWADVVKTRPEDPEAILSDTRLRGKVADKFRAKARHVVEKGDDDSKAALANLITEMGLTVRAAVDPEQAGKVLDVDAERRAGFARSLTDDIIRLTKSESEFVRLHALRALGGINADPRRAAEVFAATIKSSRDVQARRVAADGYLRLISIENYLRNAESLKSLPVSTTDMEVLRTQLEVVRHAPAGLEDADAVVRKSCAEALRTIAEILAVQFQRPQKDIKNPIPVRVYAATEVVAIKEVLKAIEGAGPRIAAALQDSSADVRLALMQTLERLADARFRLFEDPINVGAIDKVSNRISLVPPEASDPLSAFAKSDWRLAARLLTDPDVRVRRATVNFLEFFPESRPAVVGELVNALSDQDRFVRWGAARALGNFSKNYQPKDAVPAVQGLAKMLFDTEFEDRIAAAATLEALGQYAEGAVPALARAVHFGDVENRVAAMYVIQSIGPERSKSIIPSVTEALGHQDARVRRTAAETLARYGPLARNKGTIDALRRALGDEDQEVRINASEALLQILVNDPPSKL